MVMIQELYLVSHSLFCHLCRISNEEKNKQTKTINNHLPSQSHGQKLKKQINCIVLKAKFSSVFLKRKDNISAILRNSNLIPEVKVEMTTFQPCILRNEGFWGGKECDVVQSQSMTTVENRMQQLCFF